jgi:hypothetical protein
MATVSVINRVQDQSDNDEYSDSAKSKSKHRPVIPGERKSDRVRKAVKVQC